MAPDVVDADGGEFQFAAWNFGFVHPTGYPLFLILGGLFQHLVPLGNPAYRLNLFTAVTAALAVAALYLATNEITRQRGAAIIAAMSFAVTRTFWYDANAAEAYALNAFFVGLLVFIALRWQTEPTAKKFAAFCFVFGLALTHHRSIVLWMPAFALFFVVVIVQTRAWRFTFHVSRFTSHFVFFTLYFSLPLLLYLYLPLRAPASPYFVLPLAPGRDLILYDNTFTGFINYILGRTFQFELRWDAVSSARLVAFPQLLCDQFGAIGIVFGFIGFIAMLWRKEWARFTLLAAGFIVTFLFASFYHIGDILHYYIPAYWVWAIWIGYAIAWILTLATRHTSHAARFVTAICLLLTAFWLLGFQLISNFPFVDRSGETRVREHWTRLLSNPIPQNATLISNDRDEMMPLWYIQYVENTRRDVLGLFPLITPAPEYANVARLTDSVLDAGRPVYFIKPMPGLEIKYRMETAGPLVRVLGKATETPPQNSSDAVLGGRVRVLGYDVKRDASNLRITLYFQLREKLNNDYTASVQLFSARDGKIAQGNDHQVGGEFYPTTLWEVGETLRDEFVITLPPNLAPETYTLVAGMYAQPDFEQLGAPVVFGILEIK